MHSIYSKLAGSALCLTLVLQLQPAAAQQRRVSLNEAIQLSLSSSGKLKVANAKVDEATANRHEARNDRLPDVKLSGSYLRVNNPNIDLKIKTGGNEGNDNDNNGNNGSGGAAGSSVKVSQAAYAMANVSLPLFSGFRVRYGIQSAKYLEQAARLDAAHDREEVIQNTIGAYSNLYKAQKTVELVRENLAHEQQRVQDFRHLEENGLIARNDLLKAQLQESNIELSLLDAENELKMATINMSLLLGLPEGTDLAIDTAAFFTGAEGSVQGMDEPGSLAQWEFAALQHRSDKAALDLREQAAGASVKAARAAYYPGVALTGGYIAAHVPNLLTLTNAINGGIGLQYNIGALWKTGASVDAAKARLQQLQATEGMLGDQIRLEINRAFQDYLLSMRKTDVYAKAVEQAAEHYRITKNKYDNNLVTTTDLLDADVAQLQARLSHAFSRADAVVAYRKLQQTAGVLATVSFQ